MSLVFLIGGARSGKSSLAFRLAAESGAPVVFIATGEPGDAEMAERIERHRAERPAAWQTIEEPVALHGALEGAHRESCVVALTGHIVVAADVDAAWRIDRAWWNARSR